MTPEEGAQEFHTDDVSVSKLGQPPPQALRFSHGRGERLVINRKGSSNERRLGTRQCLGSKASSIWNFCARFAGKPVIASRNVGCFLRLLSRIPVTLSAI